MRNKEKICMVLNSLQKHSIEDSLRSKMVDWMIEVITKFDLSVKTFFISVKVLDKFLEQTDRCFSSYELHLLGVTCMFIASKLEDVDNYDAEVFEKLIGHNKIAARDIIKLEREILITLNFDLAFPVCVDYLSLICKVYGVPEIIKKNAENILILFQLHYNMQYLPSLETACALYLACDSLKFELNPEILSLLSDHYEFLNRVYFMHQQTVCYYETMKKFKSAMVYRKFEITLKNTQICIKNLDENESIQVS